MRKITDEKFRSNARWMETEKSLGGEVQSMHREIEICQVISGSTLYNDLQ